MGLPWDYLQTSTGIPQLLRSNRVSATPSIQACAYRNKSRPLQEKIRCNFDQVSSNPSASRYNFYALHSCNQPCFPTFLPLSSG